MFALIFWKPGKDERDVAKGSRANCGLAGNPGGVTFVAVPNLPCQLLFGTTAEGVANLLARFSGVALIGLGIACVPRKAPGLRRSAVSGLLVFNVGATLFLVWVALASTFHGMLLWGGIVLHAGIGTVLLLVFLGRSELA